METDEPVFKGFLYLPPSGKILKKAWQKRYCLLYKRSSSGVSRMEIYENEGKTGQAKIITLEDVIKVASKCASTRVINLVTKNMDLEFGTANEENQNSWLKALKSVAFPEDSIEQDNDLYCSTDEGVFFVKLHPSEASQRCNLANKNYILVITNSALQLRNDMDNALLYMWPFSFIRKYGYKDKKFTFEAGRKCASGEGTFYLEHPNHDEIYRCLSSRMKNMKKLLNGESVPSIMECGDMQLHAVFNMEPGSRNPLPPSLSPSSFQDSTKSSLGILSISSIENKPVPKKPPRKCLPLVLKNPVVSINTDHEYADINGFKSDKYDTVESRIDAWKTMGVQEPPHSEKTSPDSEETYLSWGNSPLKKAFSEMKLTEKSCAVIKEPASSPVSSQYYDCLQHFGSSNTLTSFKQAPQMNKSVENLNNFDVRGDKEYASWGTLPRKSAENVAKIADKKQAPTVIAELHHSADTQGYDHLNFFGQTSGATPNSDYKQVVSPQPKIQNSSVNLYEEVNVIEPARSADDSYLGYARIKKNPSSGALTEVEEAPKPAQEEKKEEPAQRVAHQFQNHQPYAIISKPKRV